MGTPLAVALGILPPIMRDNHGIWWRIFWVHDHPRCKRVGGKSSPSSSPGYGKGYNRCLQMLKMIPSDSSAVIALTYRSLYNAAERDKTDIACCVHGSSIDFQIVSVDHYDTQELQALVLEWLHSRDEIYTWRSAVSVMCFNYVHMHVDRGVRMYGGLRGLAP
ncbi:hypothetical protein PIB30_057261, partial [Stylosanthes scabra]|nr:hypothetical protein [Stylosanthes scabra]